jgi:hypothetical protein
LRGFFTKYRYDDRIEEDEVDGWENKECIPREDTRDLDCVGQ